MRPDTIRRVATISLTAPKGQVREGKRKGYVSPDQASFFPFLSERNLEVPKKYLHSIPLSINYLFYILKKMYMYI